MKCWLAEYGVMENGAPMPPCDGRLTRAHLIKQQVLLRELPAEVSARACSDERGWVWACGGATGAGGHHSALDRSRRLRIPAAALPEQFLAFAAEHGLMWAVQREYGNHERFEVY